MNWNGNKIRHYDLISDLIEKSRKRIVFDPFLGSGKVIYQLLLDDIIDYAVVSDVLPTVPRILSSMKKNRLVFTVDDYERVSSTYHNFRNNGKLSDYYAMREDWNVSYSKHNKLDKKGIIMFDLLTVMCSNSLIRFNRCGYFNQGYRGHRGGYNFYDQQNDQMRLFFGDKMKREKYFEKLCVGINRMSRVSKQIVARVLDFRLSLRFIKREMFVLLDPPYAAAWQYGSEWTGQDMDHFSRVIASLIKRHSCFAAFSYLKKYGEIINPSLMKLLVKYKDNVAIKKIKSRHHVGQGQKQSSDALEVIIHN